MRPCGKSAIIKEEIINQPVEAKTPESVDQN